MTENTESRRTILKVLGTSGTVAAIGGVASVQGDDDGDADEDYDDGETIEDGEEEADGDEDEVEGADECDDGTAAADLTVDPAEPGATAMYTIMVTVGEDADSDSLNDLVCDSQGTGVDVSNVDKEDVHATLECEDVTDDLDEVDDDDGETLTLGFGGSYSLKAGDKLRVVIDCVQNPDEAGEYEALITLNSQSAAQTCPATVPITDGEDEDGTDDEDADDDQDVDDDEDDDD